VDELVQSKVNSGFKSAKTRKRSTMNK